MFLTQAPLAQEPVDRPVGDPPDRIAVGRISDKQSSQLGHGTTRALLDEREDLRSQRLIVNAGTARPGSPPMKQQPTGSVFSVAFEVVANRAVAHTVLSLVGPTDLTAFGFADALIGECLDQRDTTPPRLEFFFVDIAPVDPVHWGLLRCVGLRVSRPTGRTRYTTRWFLSGQFPQLRLEHVPETDRLDATSGAKRGFALLAAQRFQTCKRDCLGSRLGQLSELRSHRLTFCRKNRRRLDCRLESLQVLANGPRIDAAEQLTRCLDNCTGRII